MEKLPMCRICLVANVRILMVNKNLHEVYEKLTDIPFVTEDRRPMLACFFCCAKLKQCYRLMRQCLEAEKLFAQMMYEDYEPNTLINQDHLDFCGGFIKSPTENISIVDGYQTEDITIKEELPAVCERLDDIIEPKEEHQSDELEPEKFDNSFLYVADKRLHNSESDSEEDVPLMEFKTEVAEEQEVSKKKRRAREMKMSYRRTLKMFLNISNNPIKTKGLEEDFVNYEQNEENLIEREILSSLPCQDKKFTDRGNIQDYSSDDNTKDPNYVNCIDSYSDSNHYDYSSQKENRKKKKLTKANEIVDHMISNPISMITPIEPHTFNYNNSHRRTSEIVKYIPPSSSSSRSSSDSSDSSDTETEIYPTAKNRDSISYSADCVADNISTIINTSPTSNIRAIIPQGDNVTQSPIIEINTLASNQTISEGRNCATSSIEPVSVDTTSRDKKTYKKNGRKRKANPMNWVTMKAKVLRNHGKSYVNRNKIYPERRLKTACGEKCKFKCKENITELQRQSIFENYWDMGDLQRQREFIMRHISVIKPRYSYKVHNSNRGYNFSFNITVGGKKIRVCKTFFKATLDISDRVIRTVIQKTSNTGILEEDRRGKHQNHVHRDPVIKDGIRKHLDSIRSFESRYCRANTKRTYRTHGSETVAELHRAYVADCRAAGVPFGNYFAYYNIFRYEYNNM